VPTAVSDSTAAAAAAAAAAACLWPAGAYYVEKRYSEAADAYSKSLAVFEMIEDVSEHHRSDPLKHGGGGGGYQ